jgi:hypothetical protein
VGEADSEKSGAAGALTVRVIVVVCVKLPDVPVMVTVAVPVVAVPLAVKVTVLLVVVLPGLKDAVTPLGSPDADKLTLPLKPLVGLTVTVLLALLPWVTETLAGDAESVKFGAAFTVSVTVVVWLRLPEVPVIVTVAFPVVAVALAVSVKLLVPVVLAGLKLAVTPAGNPDADRLTLLLKPLVGLTVMVVDPLLPCVTDRLAGDAESEKSGVAAAPQFGNLKLAMRVFQLNEPVDFMYSSVYQKVQSSTGSTVMAL